MSGRPIAYVMEQTLGSVTHYLNLRQGEPTVVEGKRHWLPIEYSEGKLPWTFRGSLDARRALHQVMHEIDGIFMHTTTLAPLCADYFGKRPTVISSDGTPANKRDMRQAYGLPPESRSAEWLKRAAYSAIFARCAGLVAWSNWTKQSFVEDYGCAEEDVAVIPPGIDLERFVAGDREHELPRILFVGGDLVRKGGDTLLEVFRKRLRGKAELILVTRTAVAEEPGVRVHQNVSANSPELRELYATSDVFVLPTRADCYSLVCMEALAASLPIVATRVGGIPDMVHVGSTGFLVDVDHPTELGDILETLVGNPAQRQIMAKACRAEAIRRFDARANAQQLYDFVRSRC
jgi:glycosyltransferase involved in cell wall biosynthesis